MPNFHPETYLGLAYSWPLDVLIHAGYYLALTIILRSLFFKQSPALVFGTLLFAFSIVLELLQAFVPKRSVTLLDVGSNALGIASGLIVYWVMNIIFNKNKTALP